ncbi:Gfo/Idh/MocA family oxidoreductase [Caulobacter sp. NIBR1757]|uniref:Gfo/Idh/MocA family protein n=1 Tax=Caulobacter sp. NIBR1757 TaxID=3016000 RepID=UPI0022EFE578|nr:Gfo/Idh/MocA family oxidoreductase [Caulobacter sp. NIBR1757]WGM39712.1 Myo-inositol 2-dehydrogenase [Caulobacter sp. NIBR1757]
MTKLLKAGVVGSGVFGGYHARKYAEMDGIELVGIYDLHPERCFDMANQYGAEAYGDLDDLLKVADIITVATPATTHARLALQCLAAGKPVYVEKPLATTLEDADRLIQAAAKAGLVLACGHQERVVSQAMGLLDIPEKPLRLEAVRKGTPSPRSQDVSVVLDLMIHDIDLALALTDAEPFTVEAEGTPDEITAEASFEDGFTAVFTASRIAQARERTMRIVYPSGVLEIDFVTREFRNSTPFALNEAFTDTPAGRDPLGTSVQGFVNAVLGKSPRPVVTGEEAARALDLALAVEQAAGF